MEKILSMAFLCLFTLFTFGCGKEPVPLDKNIITVGFSQIGAESAWRTANTKSIKEEGSIIYFNYRTFARRGFYFS